MAQDDPRAILAFGVPRLLRGGFDRLIQVSNQIFRVLYPDGNTHDIWTRARRFLLFWRELAVCGRGRVDN